MKQKSWKPKSFKFLIACLWVGLAAVSWASSWEDLTPGLRYQSHSITEHGAALYLVDMDPSRYRLNLLRARDRDQRRVPLRQLVKDSTAVAAINASFFDTEGRAMGLVIRKGEQLNPLLRTNWGIFQIVAGTASIIHTRNYRPDKQRTLAVQTGPRLVIADRIPSFRDTNLAPRSAVCITPQHTIILAATPTPLTLQRWAQALQPYCHDALNLDGGSSTQFYVKAKDVYLPGGEAIPNALGIFAK